MELENRKILILEDDEYRMTSFRARFFKLPFDIVHVETAEQAKKQLMEEQFSLIFLDHDLGGEVYVDTTNKNTGSEVVRYITENIEELAFENVIFFIHSLNPQGADYMYKSLKRLKLQTFKTPGIWFEATFNKIITMG